MMRVVNPKDYIIPLIVDAHSWLDMKSLNDAVYLRLGFVLRTLQSVTVDEK